MKLQREMRKVLAPVTNFEDVKNMSDEEYFNNNKFSIDVFKKKYTTKKDDTYVKRLYTIVSEIAKMEETPEKQKYWRERWFHEIFNDWWKPAGSIMSGVGTDKNISIGNCNTISLGALDEAHEWDNLESIIRNTGYTMAKSAAYRQGLGVDFSRLRPNGTNIDNSAKESTGAVNWMEFLDKIGYAVGQKARVPAFLFSLSIKHPDVPEFITVKKDYTRIQNANISVQITNDFYEAIEKDLDWELSFVVPATKKGQKIYLDKYSAIDVDQKDEKGYYYIAKRDRKETRITKLTSARKLFNLIAKNMWQNAEPGIQNIELAKEYSNSDAVYKPELPYNTKILSSNA